jgi:hypothetical protein
MLSSRTLLPQKKKRNISKAKGFQKNFHARILHSPALFFAPNVTEQPFEFLFHAL